MPFLHHNDLKTGEKVGEKKTTVAGPRFAINVPFKSTNRPGSVGANYADMLKTVTPIRPSGAAPLPRPREISPQPHAGAGGMQAGGAMTGGMLGNVKTVGRAGFTLTVGLDVANSTIKAWGDNNKIIAYRNTVEQVNNSGVVFSFNREYTTFTVDGTEYRVGTLVTTGSGARGEQRYSSPEFKIETLIAVAQLCELESERIKIIIGVPCNLAKNSGLLGTIKSELLGRYEIKINTQNGTTIANFEIAQVQVMAQAFGTLYDYMVSDSGEYLHPELLDQKVLVVDIGWGTLDLAIMEQGDVRSTYSFEMGISDYVASIQETVNNDIPDARVYSLNPHQMDCMMLENNNVIQTAFGTYDLSKYAAAQKTVEARKIYQRIMSLGLDFSQFYRIVMTGGGALLYQEDLEREFSDPRLIIKENSQMSNVRGFYLFGRLN